MNCEKQSHGKLWENFRKKTFSQSKAYKGM